MSTDFEPVEGSYERLLAMPGQLKTQVVCAHRVGFKEGDVEDLTEEEIAYADSILERYVQSRLTTDREEIAARFDGPVSAGTTAWAGHQMRSEQGAREAVTYPTLPPIPPYPPNATTEERTAHWRYWTGLHDSLGFFFNQIMNPSPTCVICGAVEEGHGAKYDGYVTHHFTLVHMDV